LGASTLIYINASLFLIHSVECQNKMRRRRGLPRRFAPRRLHIRNVTDLNVSGQQTNSVVVSFEWAPALPQPLPAATPPTTVEAETSDDEQVLVLPYADLPLAPGPALRQAASTSLS
jgi:hypothetical protein